MTTLSLALQKWTHHRGQHQHEDDDPANTNADDVHPANPNLWAHHQHIPSASMTPPLTTMIATMTHKGRW